MLSPGSTRTRLALTFVLGLHALASCADPGPEPAGFGLALTGPSGPGLPPDVAFLRVLYRVGDAEPQLQVAAVSELATNEGRRQLALDDLPAGSSVSVRVEGQLASGEIAYVGGYGPVTLVGGERLAAPIILVNANESEPISGAPPGRFLHSAARLPDGRVLITGGFGEPSSVACPEGTAADARCFRASALEDAWLFDPNSLSFHEVVGGLLEARAGHTSTTLPDGRVLVAGGASQALLVFDAAAPRLPRFIPVDAAGMGSALATFEQFDPDANASSVRDPARGAFVGSAAAPAMVAPLLAARFLHAAAELTSAPGQVLLVGGTSGPSSAGTFERFDAMRPGGYGVSQTSLGALLQERETPSALGMQGMGADAVWIFGGNRARSNEELAERWISSSTNPAGSVSSATTTAFPLPAVDAPDSPHPEYAFPRTLAARFADHTHALVAPAYPPFCGDSAAPMFAPTSLVTPLGSCREPVDLRRCMLVDANDGATQPCQTLQAHLAGAAGELQDGVLLSGGFGDLSENLSMSIERFQLSPEQPAQLVALPALGLAAARAFHTTTGLPEGGALSVGGLRFDSGAPLLAESAEFVRW
ncbi:MAG: hypothetical protein QM778_01245 [Myxococcales bacterium]